MVHKLYVNKNVRKVQIFINVYCRTNPCNQYIIHWKGTSLKERTYMQKWCFTHKNEWKFRPLKIIFYFLHVWGRMQGYSVVNWSRLAPKADCYIFSILQATWHQVVSLKLVREWVNLHHRNWQMLQVRAFSASREPGLLTIMPLAPLCWTLCHRTALLQAIELRVEFRRIVLMQGGALRRTDCGNLLGSHSLWQEVSG